MIELLLSIVVLGFFATLFALNIYTHWYVRKMCKLNGQNCYVCEAYDICHDYPLELQE